MRFKILYLSLFGVVILFLFNWIMFLVIRRAIFDSLGIDTDSSLGVGTESNQSLELRSERLRILAENRELLLQYEEVENEVKKQIAAARLKKESEVQISTVKPERYVFLGFNSSLVIDPRGFHPTHEQLPTEHLIYYPHNSKIKLNNKYWQLLQTSNWTLYLYSAFYDNRNMTSSNADIKIFGITNSIKIRANYTSPHCQFWFAELPNAKVVPVSSIHSVWEWRNTRGKGASIEKPPLTVMLTCPLKGKLRELVPFAVSVVQNPKTQPKNKLRVIHYPKSIAKPSGVAVCVKGLDFPARDMSHQLVEWIELILILGAKKIQFYLYSVHPRTEKVLEYYVKKGVVEVGPLTLPGSLPNDPMQRHRFLHEDHIQQKRQLETLPYNDCFYRNMYKFKYITLLDIDEVIIPLKVDTWTELFKAFNNPKASSYQIKQNGCFFHGVKQPLYRDIPKSMPMLQHPNKIPRIGGTFSTGSKGFFVTNQTLLAFNHWPIACLKGPCRIVFVNETLAQLNHYKHFQRHCGIKKNSTEFNCMNLKCLNHTMDTTLWKYKKELVARFTKAIVELGFY